ncbi:MAG: FAD-dependent oxidoreductase, partial [Acidobacteria bacterium]|nr:FAD-dependent oxidoreductase [Acidobacteriota bacterium]
MTKPVILSVDDDPEVLAAVERDLRQRYRADYRVVRAGSPAEALEVARELKQRGTPIALFLVDQRMPEMTGTELLREVRKLHPDARRVLLTAYADTDAAIMSINEVALDHYLMKPWDPPQERLYPVLDDLLGEWTARARVPFDGIRLVGSRWSPQSYAAKEFLSRNQVPYQWIEVERDEPMATLAEGLAGGSGKLPVVLFPDGSHLVAPANRELADKIGLETRAQRPFYDLVVVGCGPAGLANAVYAASEGLRTLAVEQSAPGGQAGTSSMIENYLGFPSGLTGADLARRAVAQARRFGAELLTAQEVVGLRREDPYRIVLLSDGSEVACHAVAIATGMAVRRLEVPGIDPLLGIGAYYGAAMSEAATYRDQEICVVGGANSAGQGALFFSRYARKVTMLLRKPALSPWMSKYLVDRIESVENIEVIPGVEISAVEGEGKLERLRLRSVDDGSERLLEAAAMFIFIGTSPRSEMFAGVLERDEKGFILTEDDLPRVGGKIKGWNLEREPFAFETSIPGVFAAGDVRAGANRRVAA